MVQPAGEVAIFAIKIGKMILTAMEAAIMTIPPRLASLTLCSFVSKARIIYGFWAALRSVVHTLLIST